LFKDADGNGYRAKPDYYSSGEEPLKQWQVYVDTNGDGAYSAGEPSDKTNSKGDYRIDGVPAGKYKIRYIRAQSDWAATTREAVRVQVRTGGSAKVNFGVTPLTSISGTAFEDLDGDLKQSKGEKSIAGVKFFLDRDQDQEVDDGELVEATDSSGAFRFDALLPSWYTLNIVPGQGRRRRGIDDYSRNIYGGQPALFGAQAITTSARIEGIAFEDENENGKKDWGEEGISWPEQYKVYVDLNNNGLWDKKTEQLHDYNGVGDWVLDDLPAGTYTIRFAPDGGTIVGASEYTIHVKRGQVVTDVLFARHK